MKRVTPLVSGIFALVLFVTSCGPIGDEDKTPTQAPEAMATEAQAIIEPTVTSQPPEPTVTIPPEPTATPEPSGSVEVQALWFGFDRGTPVGGASTVRISIEPNEIGDLRVGFFESEVGGTGAQWRTAGWMAVITASLLLGEDPAQYEFSFDVAGRIDGPSAGALMTAGVLANFLGHEIDPTVTMTGTINPDGTIGPVGGIPHKIEGAAAIGKTTVLVPAGQETDWDYSQQDYVDLIEVGAENGVEVRLVPDIFTAYHMLTGQELPAIQAAGQPEMPAGAISKYTAGFTSWFARYTEERSKFLELPVEAQQYEVDLINIADQRAAEADNMIAANNVTRGYVIAFEAAAFARLASLYAQLDNLYLSNPDDFGPMINRLQAEATSETRLDALIQRIDAETPRTASDALAIMEAASNISVAQGLIFEAQDEIDNLEYTEFTEQDILTAIFGAARNYALADLSIDLAEDSLSFGLGFGSSPAPDLETMERIAETLRRGAEANLAYFDALIVQPWAEDNGIPSDIAQVYFMQADDDYRTSLAAIFGVDQLTDKMVRPESQALMLLGASLTSYSGSAMLIAKYYSLDARIDEEGVIVEFGRADTLEYMLNLAEARSLIWLEGVADEDPVMPILYRENALQQSQGDAEDQASALVNYWQSTILSGVLAIFTGGV